MITPEAIAALGGVGLSLLSSYIPGLNTKYDAQSSQAKQLWMLGILAVIVGGM